MNTHRLEIYAPLQDFPWEGGDLELAPGVWIRHLSQPPDLSSLDQWLSKDEWETASGADHWLVLEWVEGSVPTAAEIPNLVLVCLWLVKATQSKIAFRFEIGRDAAEGRMSRIRLLDRFAWVTGGVHDELNESDLHASAAYYSRLSSLCPARGRLNDALVLTIAGCWSHQWQVALISHAAAVEALLTYDTNPGITRRLARSYACITETDPDRRSASYYEFIELYSARSDIMHGRTRRITETDRLPTLVRFQEILRRLWRAILSDPALLAVLEGTDDQRQAYLRPMELGFAPSPKA